MNAAEILSRCDAPRSFRTRLFLLLLWLVYCGPGIASPPVLDTPEIRVLPTVPDSAPAYPSMGSDDCCSDLFSLRFSDVRAATAAVSLQPMFSAQAGSWMFESLVHNGLFRVASEYQPSHPRAVLIESGAIDLAQLTSALSDPRILSRIAGSDPGQRFGYTLYYPIIIGPDATLFVENAALGLNSTSGTALINLGRLIVRDSRLAPIQVEAKGGKHFRPFILAWNASDTAIIDSDLRRMGYNAFLSHGLTVANHPELDRNVRARVLLSGSTLTELESGLIADGAEVRVIDNLFYHSQRYAIDASGGTLSVESNVVETTRYNSGVRAADVHWILLKGNRITGTQQSGILLSGSLPNAMVAGNYIAGARSDGMAIRDVANSARQSLDIRGNLVIGSAKSGLRLSNAPFATVSNNSFIGNAEYGINVDRSAVSNGLKTPSESATVIIGNQLMANRVAAIKTVQGGRFVFGQNNFQMTPTVQSVFAGDLVSIQTELLEQLIARKRTVEVIP
ncbi:MAG: hypothetical protein CL583_12620 [Alteromonadaceae bacterium]|nr:hypothetical protein [Alteromonadaceae bacterium]